MRHTRAVRISDGLHSVVGKIAVTRCCTFNRRLKLRQAPVPVVTEIGLLAGRGGASFSAGCRAAILFHFGKLVALAVVVDRRRVNIATPSSTSTFVTRLSASCVTFCFLRHHAASIIRFLPIFCFGTVEPIRVLSFPGGRIGVKPLFFKL